MNNNSRDLLRLKTQRMGEIFYKRRRHILFELALFGSWGESNHTIESQSDVPHHGNINTKGREITLYWIYSFIHFLLHREENWDVSCRITS